VTTQSVDTAVNEFRASLRGHYPNLAFAFQPIDAHLPALLPEEANLLSVNAVPKRRAEFQAGRAAASSALRQIGAAPVAIGKGDKGQPVWPQETVGSITHTAKLAIAAACPSTAFTGIGIDLEEDQRFNPDLAKAILTDAEMHRVQATNMDWGIYFSAKEAVYKAIFATINKVIGFHDVELEMSVDGSEYCARPIIPFSPHFPPGKTFARGRILRSNGMILSICVFS